MSEFEPESDIRGSESVAGQQVAAEGSGPECKPFGRSELGDLLRFSSPKHLRKLGQGISLTLWGVTVLLGFALAIDAMPTEPTLAVAGAIIALLAGLACFIGAWWITAPDPNGIGEFARHRARKNLSGLWVFYLFSQVLEIRRIYREGPFDLRLEPSTTSTSEPHFMFVVFFAVFFAGVAAVAIWVVSTFAGYLRSLARRMPEDALARSTGYLMWGCIITIALQAIAFPGFGIIYRLVDSDFPGLIFVQYVALPAMLACCVGWFILLFMYRRRLGEQARLAEDVSADDLIRGTRDDDSGTSALGEVD